jgi:hypothetical protein
MPSASEVPGKDTAVPSAPSAPMPGMRWRRVFPGEGQQLRALRQWLASLLPECPARDDMICVATELGTNAVQHTASGDGGWFAVEVSWHGPAVRVAVADCGSPSGPRVIDDPEAEHGRGLVMARALAIRTGDCGDHRGRLVWADIPWHDPGTAGHASAQDPYQASISDGEAELARWFAGVPAWFGRSTLQWWAVTRRGELVTAPSAQELLGLLDSKPVMPPPRHPAAFADASAAAMPDGRAVQPGPRPGTRMPPFPSGQPRSPQDAGPNKAPGTRGWRTGLGGAISAVV